MNLYDRWDSDTDRVTGRRVDVRYRRDAEPPVEPMPTVFGERRAWNRRYFRSLALPVFFPPPEDPFNYVARAPRTWLGRYTNRQRETIRAEFAARGHELPDLTGLPAGAATVAAVVEAAHAGSRPGWQLSISKNR